MTIKTEAEIRHEAKDRVKRYRAQMIEKGYTSTTIFLSQEHRDELKRLGDEHRLTRAEAAEHIFKVYLQSLESTGDHIDKNITQTHNTNTDQVVEIRAIIESLEHRIEALEKKAENQAKNQAETFPDEDNHTLCPVNPSGDMPNRSDKPAYKTWLVSQISALKDSGMGWTDIQNKFNSQGVLSPTGKQWSRGAVSIFHKRELHAALSGEKSG